MDEHVKAEFGHIQNHIEDLHTKGNAMGKDIVALEKTAEFHKDANERIFSELSGIGMIMAGIRESITELEAQLKTMCDRLGKMESSQGKSPSSIKAGFWANMNDWKKPLPYLVALIIVAAYYSGSTLADWIGGPVKLGS